MQQKFDRLCRQIIAAVSSDLFLRITLVWFLVQALYFVFSVQFGLPPDETYHYTYIQLYAQHWPSPFLGNNGIPGVLIEVSRNPFFLYHYLLGFPFVILQHLPHSYVYLRLINVAMGFGSLLMLVKVARRLKLNSLVTNLSVFMLVNTLMFVYLSASANYDNSMILLCLIGIYLFIDLWSKLKASTILGFTTAILLGCLTNINFLPFAFALVVVLIARYVTRLPLVWQTLRQTFKLNRRLNIGLSILVIILGGLMIQRFGVNAVRYSSLNPACEKVRPINDCRQSALYTRNEYLYSHKHHIPDRRIQAFAVTWAHLMEIRTYGEFSKSSFPPNRIIPVLMVSVVSIFTFALVRMWRAKDIMLSILLFICLFYLAVLLRENYDTYIKTGRIIALQGRYAFTVLPVLYLIINRYNLEFSKKVWLRALYVIAVVLVFAVSSLPTYLHKYRLATKSSSISTSAATQTPQGPAQ